MLRFENPFAFIFLAALPVFIILRKVGVFRKIQFPLTLSDWNGYSFSWKYSSAGVVTFFSRMFMILAFLSCVIAYARPVVTRPEKIYTSRGSDIIFVVDVSPSMGALDIGSSTRLEASRQTISSVVNNLSGTSFGIVAMASEAVLVVPPTTDTAFFLDSLNNLTVGELGDGTAIGTGLAMAVYHLMDSNAPKKCIILLTDGENNSGSIHPLTSARLAAENDITLYVVAVGTQGTVPVEYMDLETGKMISGYMESSFDDSMLRSLASAAGGVCYSAESYRTLSETLVSVTEQETVVQSYKYENKSEPFHFVFLVVASVCFVLTWSLRRLYLKEFL
ncbi:MAG: VWA domain-containing protein [Treponemataceae bacterium]|nr:VWA domain-containing protein [Treponemataceae bacterium]